MYQDVRLLITTGMDQPFRIFHWETTTYGPKAESGGEVLGVWGRAVSSQAAFGAEPEPPKVFHYF